ncbi:hypothetical protein JD844_019958 [Phrynosoma platyrhinos]|uniref:Uncharacterized protein n=1 Tax=Phrynosoma platyrhinos TaxID=52577 RepID=A0ABQ7TRQ3_PHRPL|nr:hypothetical protein JD844_019958 [Phrynosoma platyrhinos]
MCKSMKHEGGVRERAKGLFVHLDLEWKRFMNHRVPPNKRYQPTEYEHAANCATHAVSHLSGCCFSQRLNGLCCSPRLNLRELGPWASHMRWFVWIMASVGTVYVFFFHER